MDLFLFERIAVILFSISASCMCVSNKRILDQLNSIEDRLYEENKFRRTDTAYILTRLEEIEKRLGNAISSQISTIENGENIAKSKLLPGRKETQNRDRIPNDSVLLRAFREEKLVNTRTRRQVQTIVSTVSKLESEREDMSTVIQEVFNMLKTFKMEMNLANSEIKTSLSNINVEVQHIKENNLKHDENVILLDSKLSNFKSNTSEVLSAIQTISEDTKVLAENISATIAMNNMKIQNVDSSISVSSENTSYTTVIAGVSSTVRTNYEQNVETSISVSSENASNTSVIAGVSSTVKTNYEQSYITSSCRENEHKENGIYFVYQDFLESVLDVYCDMVTDGGGWTTFQRRKVGSVDFFRGWDDYKNGFGELDGEFWMGNKYLYEFTNASPTELWIDLVDKDDNKGHARYSSFRIGSEDEGYTLSINGYSGNVGDSLAYHDNSKFTTKDRDNDKNPNRNCAEVFTGAWWYSNCHHSNLNGVYINGDSSYKSLVWWHWHSNAYSMKFTEMKVRWKS